MQMQHASRGRALDSPLCAHWVAGEGAGTRRCSSLEAPLRSSSACRCGGEMGLRHQATGHRRDAAAGNLGITPAPLYIAAAVLWCGAGPRAQGGLAMLTCGEHQRERGLSDPDRFAWMNERISSRMRENGGAPFSGAPHVRGRAHGGAGQKAIHGSSKEAAEQCVQSSVCTSLRTRAQDSAPRNASGHRGGASSCGPGPRVQLAHARRLGGGERRRGGGRGTRALTDATADLAFDALHAGHAHSHTGHA